MQARPGVGGARHGGASRPRDEVRPHLLARRLSGGTWLQPRLQPYATQAATLCHPGCNPMPPRRQPCAPTLQPCASRFVTSAMLEASASPACLSAEGFCTPVNVGNGSIEYQPQPTAVVRFCSAATDRSGFHSLLPTALTEDEMEYDLPPLSTITLQQVHEPGAWQAYDGATVDQRLLTVSVGFAFP